MVPLLLLQTACVNLYRATWSLKITPQEAAVSWTLWLSLGNMHQCMEPYCTTSNICHVRSMLQVSSKDFNAIFLSCSNVQNKSDAAIFIWVILQGHFYTRCWRNCSLTVFHIPLSLLKKDDKVACLCCCCWKLKTACTILHRATLKLDDHLSRGQLSVRRCCYPWSTCSNAWNLIAQPATFVMCIQCYKSPVRILMQSFLFVVTCK